MSDNISQIHPVNAQYLISTEPYKLYADSRGNIYEIMVARIRDSVNAIFAYYYHDEKSQGEKNILNSTLLTPEGQFISLDGSNKKESIDMDIFHMALNPVNINGWHYQESYSKNDLHDICSVFFWKVK